MCMREMVPVTEKRPTGKGMEAETRGRGRKGQGLLRPQVFVELSLKGTKIHIASPPQGA